MHRTSRTARPLARGLLIAFLLPLGALPATAQEMLPPPAANGPLVAAPVDLAARTETLGINQTRRIGMSTRAPIADLQNENPTVVRIDKVDRDPTTVFVTGIARGTSRLIFTDVNKRSETIVIRTDDSEQRRLELLELIRQIAPTSVVQANVAPNNTVILTGYITDLDTGQRIMEAARAIFTVREGPTAIPATVFNGMRVGGVQQVQLEVIVAVVNRSRLRQMAFSWTYTDPHFTFNSVQSSPTNFTSTLMTAIGNSVGNLASSPNLSFAFLGNSAAFQGYLSALNTEGLAKIMADTRLTTLSGRPAYLVSGGETPILTSSGVGTPNVAYKAFGTVVNFLPIVQNGKIHLEVRPELSALNAANGITIPGVTPTVLPGFTTRQAQVAVQLEDGQTLAIGGLIQNTVNATITRVPILGDIPFLDVLFTNKNYNEIEEEMLILVTPRLVDGMSCTQIPKYLPGRETRSADDFELFLEGIMEAPRGPRIVSANPLHYKGAFMNSPNAAQVPCAPAGHELNHAMHEMNHAMHDAYSTHGGSAAGCSTCPGGTCNTVPATLTPPPAPATVAPLPAPAPVAAPPVSAAPAPQELPPQYITQPLPAPAPNAIPTTSLPPVRDLVPPGVPQPLDSRAITPVGFVPVMGEDR